MSVLYLNGSTAIEIKESISSSENLRLDFGKTNVKVIGWNKDYIEVKYYNHFIDRETVNIVTSSNSIALRDFQQPTSFIYKLKTFRVLKQYNSFTPIDFEIKVPKSISLSINANFVRALNCTIKSLDGDGVCLKECNVIKDFTGKGSYIRLKRCTVSKESKLNYNIANMFDTRIEGENQDEGK